MFDVKTLKEPSDYTAVAKSAEALEKIKSCMKVWIKQIEQVESTIHSCILKLLDIMCFYCCVLAKHDSY